MIATPDIEVRTVTNWRRDAVLVAYRMASEVVGKAAFFAVTVVAARRLSQDSFGLFALGTTIGWIAAVATDFGIQLHTARAVAQHPQQAARLLSSWGRVRLATAVVAVLTIGLGLTILEMPVAPASAIFLLSLSYVMSGLLEFLYYFYRGISRTDIESTLTLWQRLTTLVLSMVVLWWQPNLILLSIVMLLPVAATLGYAAPLATRLARQRGETPSEGETQAQLPPAAAVGVLTTGAGIVLSALYFRIDIFLLDWWSGTEAVGLYNAVFRLVDALRLLPAAVLAVAFPILCRASNRRTIVACGGLLTGGALLLTLLLLTTAGWVIPMLYGSRYAEAVPAFRVLVLAFPLMSLNYALTHQLLGWHGHGMYASICALALLFNVALNTQLIPQSGIVGAAWTTVWTEALISVACVIALTLIRPPLERQSPLYSRVA